MYNGIGSRTCPWAMEVLKLVACLRLAQKINSVKPDKEILHGFVLLFIY